MLLHKPEMSSRTVLEMVEDGEQRSRRQPVQQRPQKRMCPQPFHACTKDISGYQEIHSLMHEVESAGHQQSCARIFHVNFYTQGGRSISNHRLGDAVQSNGLMGQCVLGETNERAHHKSGQLIASGNSKENGHQQGQVENRKAVQFTGNKRLDEQCQQRNQQADQRPEAINIDFPAAGANHGNVGHRGTSSLGGVWVPGAAGLTACRPAGSSPPGLATAGFGELPAGAAVSTGRMVPEGFVAGLVAFAGGLTPSEFGAEGLAALAGGLTTLAVPAVRGLTGPDGCVSEGLMLLLPLGAAFGGFVVLAVGVPPALGPADVAVFGGTLGKRSARTSAARIGLEGSAPWGELSISRVTTSTSSSRLRLAPGLTRTFRKRSFPGSACCTVPIGSPLGKMRSPPLVSTRSPGATFSSPIT